MTLFRQQSNSTKTLTVLLYCLKTDPAEKYPAGSDQLIIKEQNLIQFVCCIAVHLFGHMRVDVQGGTNITMT